MRRVLACLACSVLLTSCAGSDQDAEPRKTAEPVDGMFDVGGRELYLTCEGSGSPTVILEAGLTGDQSQWGAVVPGIAKSTRVCAYDRANIGSSDPAPTPRTARDMVDDLRALTRTAKVEAPYVLVGFSIGGLVTQLYASTHPDDVAGLVLVESNHPDEVGDFEAELTKAQIAEDRRETEANPEGVDIYESFEQVKAAPKLPDRPLVVITAGKSVEWPPDWDKEVFDKLRATHQKELVGLVSDGTQVIARKSGHNVPTSEPEVIVNGIETVLTKVR